MTPVEVLNKIKEIANKHGCLSMVDSLMSDLKERRAFLFKNTDSFIVMQPNKASGYCWVTVAYSPDADAYSCYFPILLELSEALCGKPVMRFMSERKGYGRRYSARGWKPLRAMSKAVIWEYR